MLLNEFLKEHRTVQELQKEVAALGATIKDQTAQIQEMNARIDAAKPVPQIAVINRQ
jgi:hypothetical protein